MNSIKSLAAPVSAGSNFKFQMSQTNGSRTAADTERAAASFSGYRIKPDIFQTFTLDGCLEIATSEDVKKNGFAHWGKVLSDAPPVNVYSPRRHVQIATLLVIIDISNRRMMQEMIAMRLERRQAELAGETQPSLTWRVTR